MIEIRRTETFANGIADFANIVRQLASTPAFDDWSLAIPAMSGLSAKE